MANRDIILNFKGDAKQLNQVISQVVGEIKKIDNASKAVGGGGGVFGVITGGNLAARGISEAISLAKQLTGEITDLGIESVKLAANFQDTTNALAVFTGSTRLARIELADIDKVAANTPGLRLVSAEEGYQKLRALGFQADITHKLVAGLGNQKILSGVDDAAVDRVIVNLTQIRASSKDAARDIKEIIKAVPSFSNVFQDAFGTTDTSKLRSFLQQDPKAFFDKLSDGLANAERASGGVNDAFGKLEDAFLSAERTFGEPILEPLTESIKGITKYLDDNRSVWKEWGEYVSDIIRGLNADVKDFSSKPPTPTRQTSYGVVPDRGFLGNGLDDFVEGIKEIGSFFGRGADQYRQAFEPLLSPENNSTSKLVADLSGETAANRGRQLRESAPLSDNFKLYASRIGQDNTFDLSAEGKDQLFETTKERYARLKVLDDERQRNLENAKQKELALLKDTAAEANSILKNRYDQEQAIRELQNRYTAQQEIAFLQGSTRDKTAYLDSEIGRVSGFYNKQIELQKGNDEEIAKLTSEKNKKVGDLETEKVTSSAQAQKQIQELEKRIYEERRQAAIEFNGLQIKETESFYDNYNFTVSRSIERSVGDSKDGFETLKSLTQLEYESISALTKTQYEKQLEDLSLTEEQRINLKKQYDLAQADLSEQNARKLLDIEDRQYQKSLQNLETALTRRQSIIGDAVQSTTFGIGLLAPDKITTSSAGLLNRTITGRDLTNERKELEERITLIKNSILQRKELQRQEIEFSRASGDTSAVTKLSKEMALSTIALIDSEQQLKIWGGLIDKNVLSVNTLIEKIKSGNGVIADYDQLTLASIKVRQDRESKAIDEEIKSYQIRFEAAKNNGNAIDAETFTYAKLTAERKKASKAAEDEAEINEFLASTVEGLNAKFKGLISGDKNYTQPVIDVFNKQFGQEKNSLAEENIRLQQKYYADSDYLAQQDYNKRLNYERDVFNLKRELSQKGNFDRNESDAKVLDYINSQVKSLSETFADFRIGLAGTFFDAITSPFDALKKLEGLNPIVRGLAETFIDLGRDIVKAFSQKIILKLLGLDNSGGSNSGNNSGGLGSFLKNLFGGGNGSSSSSGGGIGSIFGGSSGGIFNFGNRGTSSGGSPVAGILKYFNEDGSPKDGGGSIFGKGGIFGEKGFGNNAGTFGAIGTGAAILGGAIGGRFGGFLSGAGSGLAIGAQIGSIVPGIGTAIGAGVGAIAGGLISLFGGDPKRKKDGKENLPALNKALSESFADLQQILKDSDALKFNPAEEANTKADSVLNDIKSGEGITFLSKKYQQQAAKLIQDKTKDAEILREQIRQSVIAAKGYGDTAAALVPVFATGNHFADNQSLDMTLARKAQRPHGFVAGGLLGVDRHLGLFADGETIINHVDRMNIIRGAGYDVFKEHARIPNYPKFADGNYFAPKFSGPTSAGTAANQIVIQPQIIVNLSGEGISNVKIEEVIIDGLQNSEAVKRAAINSVNNSIVYRRGQRKIIYE